MKSALKNAENFVFLMQRYETQLMVYIRRLTGANPDDAQDILQNAFIKSYRYLNSFDQELKFSSWIYRIAHNEAISWHRKNKNKHIFSSKDSEAVLEKMAAEDLSLKEKLDQKLMAKKVRFVLEKLDEKYRDVLILKFLEEKEYTEISNILKIPMGTVATLINRAKKKFKTLLIDNKITAEDL